MSFFSRAPKYRSPVGVLDCTRGSLGAALVSFSGETGQYTPRYHISVRFDATSGTPAYLENLHSALHTLHLSAPDMRRLRVFFSPSYGASHSYLLTKTFESPTQITRGHLSQLTEEAFSLFKLDEPTYTQASLLHAVGSVRVNGYRVSSPIAMQGKSLELSITVWSCSELATLLLPIIHEVWGSQVTVEYFPEDLALTHAIVHAFPLGPKNFLVATIGDESSTISTWWHGALITSASLFLGKRAVVDRVSRALNVSPDDALAFLRDRDKTPEKLLSVFQAVLVPLVKSWSTEMGSVPKSLREKHFVPGTIYLVSDEPALISLVDAALKNPSLSGFTFSTALATLSAVTPGGKECKTVRTGGTYDDLRLMLFGHFCASIDEIRYGEYFLLGQTYV